MLYEIVLLLCLMFLYLLTFSIYQLMAEEKGLLVDVEGFNIAMEAARERSRNAQTKVSCLLQCPLFVRNFLTPNKIKRQTKTMTNINTRLLFFPPLPNFLLLLSASWRCYCHGC